MFRRHNKSAKSPFVTSSYARRLRVEALEERRLLAVLTVQNNLDDTLTNLAGDGELSLREAIAVANNPGTVIDGFVSNDVADQIFFEATAFSGGDASLIRLHGVELEITETLTIDGSTVGGVTITADADDDDVTDENHITDVDASLDSDFRSLDDNSRVLNFVSAGGDLTLNSLTITGGEDSGIVTGGAGLRFDSDGSLTLGASSVSGNRTFSTLTSGGGIYTTSGAVSLTDSIVSGNRADGNITSGGGIFAEFGSVTLTRSAVSSNYSVFDGGGIFTNSGAITLMDSEVSGNRTANFSVTRGGGLATSSGAVTLTRSVIDDNFTGGDGGGIAADLGPIIVTESTVSKNTSGGNGGGIAAESGALSLINSTLSGNISGSQGGGIYVNSGEASLANSTVSHNSSVGPGGGIHSAYGGTVTLFRSTVSGNSTIGTGADGGGIYTRNVISLSSSTVNGNSTIGDGARGGGLFTSSHTATLTNSIISGNESSGTSPDIRISFISVQVINSNLIGDTTGSGIDEGLGSGNLFNVVPRLGPLADNGGPTQTHALLPGSPAIDSSNFNERSDQRGFSRLGTPTDIGAYEAQVTPSADFDSDGDVDGSDFLAWQRGLGTELAVQADGNSDDDTDVDASDLAAWAVTYGEGGAGFQALGASDELAAESLAVDVAVGAMFSEKPALQDDEGDFVREEGYADLGTSGSVSNLSLTTESVKPAVAARPKADSGREGFRPAEQTIRDFFFERVFD